MIQTARGAVRAADKFVESGCSHSSLAGELGHGVDVEVVDDAFVPGGISRRTRFAPIRPRPIIPSCMGVKVPTFARRNPRTLGSQGGTTALTARRTD